LVVAAFICFILPAVLDIGLNGMVSFLTFVCKVTKLVAPETLDHQLVNRLPATATLFLGCKQCHRTLFYLVMIAADFLIINSGESHSTQSGATVACVPSAFKFPALAACTLCCFTMTRFSSLPLSQEVVLQFQHQQASSMVSTVQFQKECCHQILLLSGHQCHFPFG
jgi:hypothetical protein